MLKKVDLYTDGACSGNPGPGGWAAILKYKGYERELSGGSPATTNNRMEMCAVIEGLNALNTKCSVTVRTDSRYVADAVNNGWALDWKRRGWKRKSGDKALNEDLWETLLELLEKHDTQFIWVKGHDGDCFNERCDALAVGMSKQY